MYVKIKSLHTGRTTTCENPIFAYRRLSHLYVKIKSRKKKIQTLAHGFGTTWSPLPLKTLARCIYPSHCCGGGWPFTVSTQGRVIVAGSTWGEGRCRWIRAGDDCRCRAPPPPASAWGRAAVAVMRLLRPPLCRRRRKEWEDEDLVGERGRDN